MEMRIDFPECGSFYAIGDIGRANDRTRATAQGMATLSRTQPPACVLGLGDNFYPSGTKSVKDPRFETTWADVWVRKHDLRVPWLMTLGNHDVCGNWQSQIDFTNCHAAMGLWKMPAASYVCHAGPVDFFCIDTNGAQSSMKWVDKNCRKRTRESIEWLDSALRRSSAAVKIVFGHHPLYTKGSSHGADGDELASMGLERLFSRHHVAAYYAGHEHVMQYYHNVGVHHVIAGASGGDRVRFYHHEDVRRPMKWWDYDVCNTGFVATKVNKDNTLDIVYHLSDSSILQRVNDLT